MPKVIISRDQITDYDDIQATVALAKNSTKTVAVSFTARNGYNCYLCFVGQAWDAAIDTYVTWRVTRGGQTIYTLKDSTVQIAAPNEPQNEIAPWILIPQGEKVEMNADLSNASGVPSGGGNFTGRLRAYYVPVNPYQGE